MTLEEIWKNWSVDSKIDPIELGNAALAIPQLHNKYWQFLSRERLAAVKLRQEFVTFYANKVAWAKNELTTQELADLGWTVNLKRYLKSEIDEVLKSDKDVINYNLRVAMADEKIEALKDIIKMISNRSFQVSNAIAWNKFKSGG